MSGYATVLTVVLIILGAANAVGLHLVTTLAKRRRYAQPGRVADAARAWLIVHFATFPVTGAAVLMDGPIELRLSVTNASLAILLAVEMWDLHHLRANRSAPAPVPHD